MTVTCGHFGEIANSIQSFAAASTAMVASSSHRILEYIPDIADGDIDNPGALRRLRQYITGLWYYATHNLTHEQQAYVDFFMEVGYIPVVGLLLALVVRWCYMPPKPSYSPRQTKVEFKSMV